MATAPRKGFNPAKRVGSTTNNGGLTAYTIASGYATGIGVGDSVKLHTDGTIIKGVNAASNLGVFAGCSYVDSAGRLTYAKNWPASTVATEIVAWVIDDPFCTFYIPASTAVTSVLPGQLYAVTITTPDTVTGRSTLVVDTSATVALASSMVKVIAVADVDNKILEVVLSNQLLRDNI